MPDPKRLENPFPFLIEASDAATKLFRMQRDYLSLSAELRARREAKRAAFLIGALISLNIMATLTLFWLSFELREAGLASWAVALLSLAVFGLLTALLVRLGMKSGKAPHSSDKREAA